MSVKVREYKKNNCSGWEVDVRILWADGTEYRERRKARVTSKSGARRWGEARERELLQRGKLCPKPAEVAKRCIPTLREFHPRFIEEHCRAERHKPSGIERKQSVFRVHLLPMLGETPLDQITQADVQQLKVKLSGAKPKSVNNVLTVLNKSLGMAVEWGVIESLPCKIKLLRSVSEPMSWYESDDYVRLVDAARQIDRRSEVLVRFGGDGGLRRGEAIGARWCDVDLKRGLMTVRKAVWNGHEGPPKGGKPRVVPLTIKLREALEALGPKRGQRILCTDEGKDLTAKVVRRWMEKAQRTADLKVDGGVHQLRHTFCSRLAMMGAPAKAIQELAGHADLTTTMRYMHLSPSVRDNAIKLLDQPPKDPVEPDETDGEINLLDQPSQESEDPDD